jgi:hypothetical protein
MRFFGFAARRAPIFKFHFENLNDIKILPKIPRKNTGILANLSCAI